MHSQISRFANYSGILGPQLSNKIKIAEDVDALDVSMLSYTVDYPLSLQHSIVRECIRSVPARTA